ncbi:S26 family signal peptidase [Phenylobacterium sp.]|uniref:S26 family signal peptidase n=1 Tax=Phenylobacterium sp. TaxID=1871053 RepID=UPI003D282826
MRTRWKPVAIAFGAAIPLALTAVWAPRPLILWNITASAPEGVYWLSTAEPLRGGELVVALPPAALETWLDAAGFLPRGVPLLKRVAALEGQRVCSGESEILVDGRPVARPRRADRFGRPLPSWSGCRTLRADEVFLLNPAARESLDGRYFGPSARRDVVARARPLWTFEGR